MVNLLIQTANGAIDFAEFQHLVGRELVASNFRRKELLKEFQKFDKDGDGFITGQ